MVKPEDAEGEDAVYRGLCLFVVDGDDSPCLLALHEGATSVSGAEGFLEVHRGAEGFGFQVGEVAEEDAFEKAEVFGAGCFTSGWRAAVFVGSEFERLGLCLAEALGTETQDAVAWVSSANAADEVAVFAPEVEGAGAVLGGEGVLRLAHVEDDFAIFKNDCLGVLGEEGLQRDGDGLRRLFGRDCR